MDNTSVKQILELHRVFSLDLMLTEIFDDQEQTATHINMRTLCNHRWKSPIAFSCHSKSASEYPEVILLAYVCVAFLKENNPSDA